ncbi:hypothetical protein BT96DRAFT_1024836 [Gymnopus androsaceus JB14]|uniref:Uncharacterized protein n=1 Tax=Gymnopus androsaceus JB14 TaxID=1447944 RepID=A0A6A4GY10_9AGAR|nr:hypothetical protein BT96DRAFT_1024836 [Gymnopus androsaceus JB14]
MSTATKSKLIADMLRKPLTSHSNILPLHPFFVETKTMPFDGDQVQSILPVIIQNILYALSEPNDCYLPLQEIYIPAVSGYQYTARQADKLDELILRCSMHAKKLSSVLYCALTMQKDKGKDKEETEKGQEEESYDDSVLAFVPVIDSKWNTQVNPTTLFFRPTIDLLFRNSKTPEEQSHVISYAMVVVCRELGRLFPRFIYGSEFHIPSHIKFPEGETAVEIFLTGGFGFAIDYKIEETPDSIAIRPVLPHGFRICTSQLFVILDNRIQLFLESFFVEQIPILLHYTVHGMPVLGERYRKVYNVTSPLTPLTLGLRDTPALVHTK